MPKPAELDATVSVPPGIPVALSAGSADAEATEREPSEPIALPPLSAGDLIGRYILRAPLGQGGMGVVWEADDPDLERRVALKLVVSGERSHGERLVREARAQARLSHPNVLPIYDVGDVGVDHARPGRSEVYIAMELAPGGTLRQWTAAPHEWPEILKMYIDAGRGLAAAHAAGVVHRDFKPANVLIGQDGQPRVADFGLALAGQPSTNELSRAEDEDPSTLRTGRPGATRSTGPAVSVPVERLTATGTVMGTIEYMAPEQHQSRRVDGRADQFAYCVALFGALYGRRPYASDDPIEIAALKAAHRLPELTGARAKEIPRAVHAAIVRGLSPDPNRRFVTMDALLSALATGLPSGRRLGPWIVVVGAATLGAAVWGATWLPDLLHDGGACHGDEEPPYGEDTGRAALEAAFSSVELPRARHTWPRVDERLQRYAEQWDRARHEACTLGPQAARFDPAMRCLEGRRHGLEALVEGLSAGLSADDPEAVVATLDGAVEAVVELPDPHQCLSPADAVVADAGPRHQRALSRSRSLRATHRPEDALSEAELALAEADAHDSEAGRAAALLERGRARLMLAERDAAHEDWRRAYFVATEAGDDGLAGRAALDLATSLARSADLPAADRWLEHARAAVDRTVDEWLAADVLLTETLVRVHAADGTAAIEAGERALAAIEALRGTEHPDVAGALTDLAYAFTIAGQHEQAIASLHRARAIYEPVFGKGHPALVNVYTNLGLAQYRMARFAEGKQSLQTALEIRRAIVDGDDAQIATLLGNLGLVHTELGQFDEALELHRQSQRMRQALYGQTHPLVAASWLNLGLLHYRQAQLTEAEDAFSRALEGYVASVGQTHPDTARVAHNLGLVLREQDRSDEAIAQLRTARDGFAAANQRDLQGVATMELGATLVMSDRAEEGLAMLAEALPILEATTGAEGYYIAMLHRYRGLGHRATGDLDTARRDLTRCVELATAAVAADHFLAKDCAADLAALDSEG